MSIEFHCPSCGKLLETTDDKAGMRAKCPDCFEPIDIPGSMMETGEDSFGPDFQDGEGEDNHPQFGNGPHSITTADTQKATKNCPNCGEQMKAAEVRCWFCGEEVGDFRPESEFHPTPINAGDVFSDSWKIFKSKMGICIGGVFIAWIVIFMAGLPSSVLHEMIRRGIVGPELRSVWFVLFLLSITVQVYMSAGINIFLLNVVRGQRAEIGDLFKGGPYFFRMLGSTFLFSLAVFAGYIMFIIPGIIITLMFWPYSYILVDQNPPGMNCLSRAKQITRKNLGEIFLLGLASFGINMLGMLACCVGLVFTIPLTTVMMTVAYCRMTGQRIDLPVRQ